MIFRFTREATNESILIPVLRHIAVLPLKALGVAEEDISRVATIISEGCSNVVKYAYEGREIYTISMQYCAVHRLCRLSWDGPWDVFGRVARSCGLEWGGDFNKLEDRPHVQWTRGKSLAQMRALRGGR